MCDGRWRMVVMLAVVCCAGCWGGGPDDMPDIAPVTGTLTLDGQPLGMAHIIFTPIDGGQTSEAYSDPTGQYALVYKRDIMGAKIGKHKVVVTTFEEPESTDDGKTIGGVPERVPAKYNANTTLQFDVNSGENVIDLQLTSK